MANFGGSELYSSVTLYSGRDVVFMIKSESHMLDKYLWKTYNLLVCVN